MLKYSFQPGTAVEAMVFVTGFELNCGTAWCSGIVVGVIVYLTVTSHGLTCLICAGRDICENTTYRKDLKLGPFAVSAQAAEWNGHIGCKNAIHESNLHIRIGSRDYVGLKSVITPAYKAAEEGGRTKLRYGPDRNERSWSLEKL